MPRQVAPLLLLCIAAGCNSDGANLPRTVPATGVVSLDGKPVEGAQVILVPSGDAKTGAFATTDASGRFALRAFEQKDGAIPGEYTVQVSKTVEVKLDAAKGSLDGGDPVRFDHGVPPKYGVAKSSGLTVTIPDKGIRDINFALKSK